MVVVLLIVVILVSIAFAMLGGAKSSARGNEAKAIGSTYAQAISQYQTDNANKNPPAMASANGASAGPTNLLGKPYITTMPEAAGVRVGVDMSGGCAAPGGGVFTGWVAYCPEGAGPVFGVRVNTRATISDPWSGECWIGRTAKTPRC
jgi:hypothetical protein